MGRLEPLKASAGPWLLPAIVALATITLTHVLFLGPTQPSRNELAGYIDTNKLTVDTETIEGYQQVYYLYNDVKVYITNGQIDHAGPVASGKYIAWTEQEEGSKNLVRYDLLNKTRLQLSYSDVNFNPTLSDTGEVTWQRIVTTTPQPMQFDGISVRKL